MAASIIAVLIGVNGLRLTGGPDGNEAAITVVAEVQDPVGWDDRLPIRTDDAGFTNTFGQGAVRATSSFATLELLDPSASQRVVWIIWQLAGPTLGLLIAWPLLRLARTSRLGDPFTRANERRLWRISGLAITGGLAYSAITGMAETLLIQRSAAADMFIIAFEISFIPIAAGLVIAALASIWRIGVSLREDADATI